jgi:deoxyribodipyrimidine photo-lyase|tara:strand:+ start:16986 stop:18290 length:1305 start_codon:yes stop_codon:yes gene_type:complete
MEKITLFWFRRDLRIEDNCGLFHALNGKNKVLPIFIFDKEILKKLPKQDARLEMILMSLNTIDLAMKAKKCSVGKFHGTPKAIFIELIKKWRVEKVICNEDYEPYATNRDAEIRGLLEREGVAFEMHKDQVIFAKDEIVKKDGSPYKVYTPFSRKWLERFEDNELKTYPSETLLGNLISDESLPKINLADLGFDKSTIVEPKYSFDNKIIDEYEETRNFPSLDSTSRLGSYLRFGIVSVRSLVQKAASRSNNIFLKELIWREFFMQILWHFPHTSHKSFKPQYDRIEWLNNPTDFEKWCKGDTGYPLVDAGMRQLNQTGFMHNRVRMLVGSFLCKHLLIDWRWGEAYFAEKLLDYEMSSNIGNWQWVAGCGVDAAPYFRIFNPSEQVKKFDKELRYIQKWVPNFQEIDYPAPMVDHKKARERCLMVYKTALSTL